MTDFVKALPSTRTTIQVLASRGSGCSKARTYSYLEDVRLLYYRRIFRTLLGVCHYMNGSWEYLRSRIRVMNETGI